MPSKVLDLKISKRLLLTYNFEPSGFRPVSDDFRPGYRSFQTWNTDCLTPLLLRLSQKFPVFQSGKIRKPLLIQVMHQQQRGIFVCSGLLFVCSFVRLFVCSFVCLFVCLFVCSFVRLFVCLNEFHIQAWPGYSLPKSIEKGSKKSVLVVDLFDLIFFVISLSVSVFTICQIDVGFMALSWHFLHPDSGKKFKINN